MMSCTHHAAVLSISSSPPHYIGIVLVKCLCYFRHFLRITFFKRFSISVFMQYSVFGISASSGFEDIMQCHHLAYSVGIRTD